MNLKQKTITGITWSFIDKSANLGVTFIIGIILARLLSPKEFGLVGMLTIFISISNSIVDSGFSQALIRKKSCTEDDFSTVFYFNFLVGLFMFALLATCAPLISRFFNEPLLIPLIRVLSITLIIDSLTIIQRTILTKNINFKLQTKISIIASVLSGGIAVVLAYKNFGVWSLVAQQIANRFFNSLFLWIWNKWRPLSVFSKKSFSELFNFGYKLLIAGIIRDIAQNIYYAIIGKYFSASDLGFYSQAERFNKLPSQDVSSVIQRVTYPVLAEIEDEVKLKLAYQKIIKSTVLITFMLMLGMAAVAEPLIITLIGEKWRKSVIMLQMLSFVGMMYPLHSINLNMLNIKGRSDLFLRLTIIKRLLIVPTIVIGLLWGINVMIAGMIFNSLVSYYLNSYWSGKLIRYPINEQIKDIIPYFLISLVNGTLIFFIGLILPFNYGIKLIIQSASGLFIAVSLLELIRPEVYLEFKKIVLSYFKTTKKKRP
ncbi:lipopolysaccharide biosynthesis protein [Maribellus comscasis]|uniref:lipopolysaccharide biosynthesis protein n=1 Tax=Maribellus comscasis TaxID=2681766 RepID=UPI001C2D2879|nr:lipopolysaccharide biosynthesis protein [Maribellus comscasis]